MRSEGHWFLFGPPVGGRIVFIYQACRVPKGNQAGEDVELAVRGLAHDLLVRVWERSDVHPLPLRMKHWSTQRQQRQDGFHTTDLSGLIKNVQIAAPSNMTADVMKKGAVHEPFPK